METADLEAMLKLAELLDDRPNQVTVLNRLEYVYTSQGEFEQAQLAAERAIDLSRSMGDRRLEA